MSRVKQFFINQKMWLWPILAALIITPFSPSIDMAIARYFYDPDTGFSNNEWYAFVFNYGVVPAQLLFIASAILFLGSYLYRKWKPWRTSALTLILTLLIGSGLIGHVLLKDRWGRPRPKQVVEFGGMQPFRPYYSPNFFHQPEPSKSFVCGHCTMGFYFFALALVGRRLQYRWLFWCGVLLSIILGGILSLTRVAQGGHFFSDALMAALVMWLTAYCCDRFLNET